MSQPDPKPGRCRVAPVVLAELETASRQHRDYVDLWPWLEARFKERIEAGRQKYGTLLETHNGRDALEDAWEEAADCVQYLTQDLLEGSGAGSTLTAARGLLLRITRTLWERDVRDTVADLEGGEHPPMFNEREEAKTNEHDPSLFRGDWCDCAACRKAARQGFRRNSEPE